VAKTPGGTSGAGASKADSFAPTAALRPPAFSAGPSVLVLAVRAATTAIGHAQYVPDGFADATPVFGAGVCCTDGAVPHLPLPPNSFEIPALFGCCLDCDLETGYLGKVAFDFFRPEDFVTPPTEACDEIYIRTQWFMAPAASVAGGPCPVPPQVTPFGVVDLRAKDVETYELKEGGGASPRRQVWRYLVRGNFRFSDSAPVLTPPCPVPSKASVPDIMGGFGVIAFSEPPVAGYVDLSRTVTPPSKKDPDGEEAWEAAIVLTHWPSCLTNTDSVDLNGFALDPSNPAYDAGLGRYYHFVAPRADCAPYFTWAVNNPPITPADFTMGRAPGAPFNRGFWRSSGSVDPVGPAVCFLENDAVLEVVSPQDPECLCVASQPIIRPTFLQESITNTPTTPNGLVCTPSPGGSPSLIPWNSVPGAPLTNGPLQDVVGTSNSNTSIFAPVGPGLIQQEWLYEVTVVVNAELLAFQDPCSVGPQAFVPTSQITNGVTTIFQEGGGAFFDSDLPSVDHFLRGSVVMSIANSVNIEQFTHPNPYTTPSVAVFVPVDAPYFPASAPTIGLQVPTGPFLELSGTASTSVWSFWR
jgi:hypothetical protein